MRFLLPLLLLTCSANSLVAAESAPRPNVVIVMVDDMGFSDLGCYGSEIPTPHLDRLARNGRAFAQFYNTGRCCPTRASLLTGLTSHRAGVGWMTADHNLPGYRGRLLERCPTVAELMREAGYFTAMCGKWHVGFEHGVTPKNSGFDRSLNLPAGGLHFSNQTGFKGDAKLYLDGEEVPRDAPRFDPPWYGTHLWIREGVKFIDEALAKEQPFFLYVAHVAPHFPCMAPEKTIAKYRGKYMAGWDALRIARHERQIASDLIDARWKLPPRPDAIPAWDSLPEPEQTRYDDMMAIYAAMIDEVDASMGTLVTSLKQRGAFDNTLILFLSDNGGSPEAGVKGRHDGERPGDPHSNVWVGQCWAHLSNTPFRKYKRYAHEGGIATPLIAHWPNGIEPPDSSDDPWIRTPTHVVDLLATCLDLAGADYPAEHNGETIPPLDGRSLVPLLTGTGEWTDRPLYWEHEGNGAFRVGDKKLVRSGVSGTWELYDLKSDRTEQHNLAESHPEEVEAMVTRWRTWAAESNVIPRPQRLRRKK